MTVLTFTQADGLYTTDVVAQTNDFSVETNKLKADSIPATNDARILFNSQADGTFSVDISTTTSNIANNVGLVFRAVDVDNNWQAFTNFSQNRVRLVKLQAGSGTPVYDEVLGGYGVGADRELSVECSGDTIVLKQGGITLHTETDSTFQTATLSGLRIGNTAHRLDNLTFPTPASSATKTVTFALHEDIQGLSGVNYIITPNPLGDSITSGSLDTSGTTVTIGLDSFASLSAGDGLLMIATDKQVADDNTDVIAWDASTVVEV